MLCICFIDYNAVTYDAHYFLCPKGKCIFSYSHDYFLYTDRYSAVYMEKSSYKTNCLYELFIDICCCF